MNKAGLFLSILIFSSCVNENFDLSNGIVADATLFENISLPVGDVEKITLEQLLFAEGINEAGIMSDPDGNLYMGFAGGKSVVSIGVDKMNLDSFALEEQHINFNIPEQFAGLPANIVDLTIKYSDVVKDGLDISMEMEVDSPLPDGISNVSEIYLDSGLSCTFSVSTGKIYISQDFQFVFPEYMSLSLKKTSADYEVVDNHIVRFVRDVVLSAASPLSLNMSIDCIRIPENKIVTTSGGKKRLVLDSAVDLKGDFYIRTKDFTVVPSGLDIAVNVALDDMTVTKALAEIDLDTDIPGKEIRINDIPDFLKSKGVCLDFYNPVLSLSMENDSPFEFSVSADLTAYNASEYSGIHLGNNGQLISVPALSSKIYRLSRRELEPVSGMDDIVLPEISDLISTIPDKITIDNAEVSVANTPVMIETGKTYSASVSYDLTTPLAFDKDLYIAIEQDVYLNLELGAEIKTASATMDIINSVPVDFEISAACIDDSGSLISGTYVSIDKSITAGSLEKPTTTSVLLSIDNSNGKLVIGGLRLNIKARSINPEYHGISLNRNQGFEIRNIGLTLPDGLGVEIK